MVGVPRSTGCRMCLQRRVKCDESRPECLRCVSRRLKCPGYQKPLRFYNQTVPPDDKHKTNASLPVVGKRAGNGSQISCNRILLPHATPMDAALVPSLVDSSMDIQQKELFCHFVNASFPGLFTAWSNRVDLNWMDFVRHHLNSSTPPDALVWSVRCLSTFFAGKEHKDRDKITCSRHMYSRALRHLSQLIRKPGTVKSDATLGAAILLAVYEMMDGTGELTWLTHSGGIGTLIRLRGCDAHREGFGRTLLISFRAFLVADAFLRGEACFLADEEWQSGALEAMTLEETHGKGSWLGDVVERAFSEVTACPGLFARAHNMIKQTGETDLSERSTLVHEISFRLDRLTVLQNSLSGEITGIENRPDLLGSVPVGVASNYTRSSLQGIHSAIALLNQLLILLESDRTRRLELEASVDGEFATNPWSTAVAAAETEPAPDNTEDTYTAFQSDEPKSQDWLDQVALSMGMLAIKP